MPGRVCRAGVSSGTTAPTGCVVRPHCPYRAGCHGACAQRPADASVRTIGPRLAPREPNPGAPDVEEPRARNVSYAPLRLNTGSTRLVAEPLSADAGLVSEILRLANSSVFGLAGRVSSLRTALTLLGPRRVRSLVLVRSMVGQMSQCSTGCVDAGYFWRRSLTTGVLSARVRNLAGHIGS